VLLQAVLGLVPDVPHGTLHVAPVRPSPVGALRVHGLRLAGAELALEVDAAGTLGALVLPAGVRLA
jgi:hypothetical protein